MTFARFGFQFEHPDEWAPTSISGSRKAGYVRISSAERAIAQVRWQRLRKPPDLHGILNPYLQRLDKDSRRAKARFRYEINEEDEALRYRYQGSIQGRGVASFRRETSSVYLVEVAGGRSDPLLSRFREVSDSFRVENGSAGELWALFGLRVRMPQPMKCVRQKLLAGRTTVDLSALGASFRLDRWAFAQALVERHGFKPWAEALLSMKVCDQEADGAIRLRAGSKDFAGFRREAIVGRQPERDQITIVSGRFRDDEWRPQSSWLTF